VSRRRRLLLALAVVVLLGGGAAVYVYLKEVRPPGDVFNADVPFEDVPEETPTPTPPPQPSRPQADTFVWPQYGFSDQHRRVFQPAEKLEGPFRRVWKRKATALLEFPPVIARGVLYQLADDGWLVARNKHTGRRKWRRKIGTLAASSPAYEDGNLYVTVLETPGGGAGRALSLRGRDGRIRWSRMLPSRTESSPLVHEGRMYFGSEDGTVCCLD